MVDLMELDLGKQEVFKGYQEFSKFISKDINKQLLITTIENYQKGSEWPKSYFDLRDDVIPDIIGYKASKFLFWLLMGGLHAFETPIEFKIREDHKVFLNFLYSNYAMQFTQAKMFNVNPLGFSTVNFTHSNDSDYFHTYLLRNDSEQLLMRLDTRSFSSFITESAEYFSQMIEAGVVNLQDEEEPVNDIIQSLEESIERLRNSIKHGEE